jgi:hypothetical protein
MFHKPKYEDRLLEWKMFRDQLEVVDDPIQYSIDYYNQIPDEFRNVDPYDNETWPGPWETIEENHYCKFSKLLGICYSLQLTDRFSLEDFEIHIVLDRDLSNTYYLLNVGDRVVGYEGDTHVAAKELPKNLQPQQSFTMPPLQ